MENKLFDFERFVSLRKMIESVRAGKSCSIFGVQNSLRPALAVSVSKKILFLTADDITAERITEKFELMGKKACLFPQIPDSFLYKKAGSNDRYIERSITLSKIVGGEADVVVAPASSLFAFLPNFQKFKSAIIKVKQGQNIEPESLEKKLVFAGYTKESLVYSSGQFSRRGEILDIFPVGSDVPYRLDFFDTEIETIKVFDITTNKGTKEEKSLEIFPCTDLLLEDEQIEKLKSLLQAKLARENDGNSILSSQINEALSRLDSRDVGYSMEFLNSYFPAEASSVFDYLDDFVVVIDECKQVYDKLESFSKETRARVKELAESKQVLFGENCGFGLKEILNKISMQTAMAFLKITNTNRFFESKSVFSFSSAPASRFTHNLKSLSAELANYIAAGYEIWIYAGSKDMAKSVQKLIRAHDINAEICGFDADFKVKISTAGYESGFILPDEKLYVLGTYDIFPKKRKTGSLNVGRDGVFTIPKVGDYVVHEFHGIGVCEGVTTLSGNLGTKDYVVVRYRDGDKLYVPTSNMDMLSRFSGAEKPARLSKIGGVDFSAVKERVKKSVKKLAFDLLELYAKREKTRGFAFSEDNDMQREFEDSFAYTETEDQLTSSEEIKKDMQSAKVMDRLLCGDVGFGKTEVALRACFKAIMDGKQVAFIAPTTILSEQHAGTAKARMNDFGIKIEVLNRFKTKQQISKALMEIKTGNVDLVCGTHRILSDDVEFKNLGLIVLDEEQKFGVEDKEKLKNKYPNVDVLTLSATPIPRTLSMSLSGIRDISIISTPPSERLPVQTYVTEYSDTILVDAIKRELSRDGQVFVLYNSVEKIYHFAAHVKNLVKEAEVAVAHGQMQAKVLEDVIYNFYNKKSNVLVCTTIIENGIDIENANTLIVIDSDKLGLSSLYQIRGRVGRGYKLAYAYFTYESSKVLSEEAYKRLDALSEFCEFGSGFKLSMRDLEIRGGGNIFGAEQSGHMQKVGYDLYTKMLSQAVKELKGEEVQKERDVLVKVALDAYISDTYISTSEERMVAYKRISEVMLPDEVEKLRAELVSAYGKIPDAVSNLIEISQVRKLASKLGATEISSLGKEVYLNFEHKDDILKSEALSEALFGFRLKCSVDTSAKPVIKFTSFNSLSENFESLKEFLLNANKFLNKTTAKN